MGQADDLTQIKGRLAEAFRATKPEKKGEALLSRFEELSAILPQSSEIIAYKIADASLAELERVLGHLRQNYQPSPFAQAEPDWNTIAHALVWAAMWKAHRALNEAFSAAKREGA